MKKIRWGIVGPGGIANKFAKAIKNVDCAELVAVASRSEQSGKAFAEKYDISNVFCGYESMAKSDVVDAVYIATPHPFHKPCTELFLENKKHVLCEKPICVNAMQAKALQKTAKENSVFLMEAMWTRFLPAVNEAISIVKSGEIGDVLGVSADFCYSSTPKEESKIYLNNMAGGSLLDVGTYGLHFASLFLGSNPELISAVSNVQNGVDVHTHVLLRYRNGAIADISSAIGVKKPPIAYIYGSKGRICLPTFYGAQELLLTVGENTKRIAKPSIGDGFEEEIYEACNCINSGKTESDTMTLNESIAILEIMDEIRKQIEVKYPFDVE